MSKPLSDDGQWRYCEVCAYGIRSDGKTPGAVNIGSIVICSDCMPLVDKIRKALKEEAEA